MKKFITITLSRHQAKLLKTEIKAVTEEYRRAISELKKRDDVDTITRLRTNYINMSRLAALQDAIVAIEMGLL